MSILNLTTASDTLTGTDVDDTFVGPPGGVDHASGGKGNDQFFVPATRNEYDIVAAPSGVIDGGEGFDVVFASHSLGTLQLIDVESLVVLSLYGDGQPDNQRAARMSIQQLATFSTIGEANTDHVYSLELQGNGGTLDLANTIANARLSIGARHIPVLNITAVDGGAYIYSGTGADTVTGGTGHDVLWGGGGDDLISGGAGHDHLFGEQGNDTIHGGGGDDVISLQHSALGDFDAFYLGSGNDQLDSVHFSWSGIADGGDGTDSVWAHYGFGKTTYTNFEFATISGSKFQTSLETLGSFQSIRVLNTVKQLVLWNEGGSIDLASKLSGDYSPILVADKLISGLDLSGTARADRVIATQYADTLRGCAGNDRFWGNSGNDMLYGGDGNDTLGGFFGDDTLYGGLGDDLYFVNSDRDVVIEQGPGIDTLWVKAGGHWTIGVDVENFVYHGSKTVSVQGNSGANLIMGGGGMDALFGDDHNDTLLGGRGDDRLLGDDGDDTLHGDVGNNTLTGGAGRDVFVLNAGGSSQTVQTPQGMLLVGGDAAIVTDFTVGQDKIGLDHTFFSALAIGPLPADAFFIVNGPLTTTEATRVIYHSSTGSLSYDADGEGGQNPFFIGMLGPGLALTASEFVVL